MQTTDQTGREGRLDDAGLSRAATPSIWAFIAADCASFGIFFAVFMVQRIDQPALFNQSARLLDVRLGLLNTMILITSSWLVALGAAAARRNDLPAFRRLLFGAIGVAAWFAAVKFIEYGDKIRHDITPLTNDFFSYYFVLTGVHLLHYLVGMAVLIYLYRLAAGRRTVDRRYLNWIESGGIYWHMVDLLWVVLFPMFYLLGRN